jgi:hypothetical protein
MARKREEENKRGNTSALEAKILSFSVSRIFSRSSADFSLSSAKMKRYRVSEIEMKMKIQNKRNSNSLTSSEFHRLLVV